jgi:uncharacterized protein (TIGR02300 family)
LTARGVHGKRAQNLNILLEDCLMAKNKLGTKQICPSCEVKFYDLNKRPAICPKCDAEFDPEDETVKTSTAKVKEKTAKAAVKSEDGEDDEDEEEAKKNTDEDEEDDEEAAKELGGDENEIIMDGSNDTDDDDAAPGKVPAGFTEEGVDDDEDAVLDDDEDANFTLDVDGDDAAELPGDGDDTDED